MQNKHKLEQKNFKNLYIRVFLLTRNRNEAEVLYRFRNHKEVKFSRLCPASVHDFFHVFYLFHVVVIHNYMTL